VVKRKITLDDAEESLRLFGHRDDTLKILREMFAVRLVARGNEIQLTGTPEEVTRAEQSIERLREQLRGGHRGFLTVHDVRNTMRGPSETTELSPEIRGDFSSGEPLLVSSRKKPIVPRTKNQALYVEAIRRSDVVFGIGPAGTGKTYLAVTMAVSALRNGDVARVILTRPAVEAGEKLGFLPGDMQDKVDPYLRPLYDALYDMMEYEKLQRLFQQRVVEVAPIAYMRGRTLSNAFIILDEAQNTTPEQMKMFLTRMGVGSRMVVTGDITQMDLPAGKASGLVHVMDVLKGVPGIEFILFDSKDVVRHSLVQAIIEAYAKEKDRT